MDVNPAWYRWQGDTLELLLRVQPRAGVERVENLHAGRVRLKTNEPAHEDRANRAVTALLADGFGVAKRDVSVVKGASQRDKEVAIVKPRTLPGWFEALGGGYGSCGQQDQSLDSGFVNTRPE